MEYFDVVDEKGNPTGEIVSRKYAHENSIRHRTAHIWIIRKNDNGYDVLLQQRSFQKDSFPGLWDTSSAGHIQAHDEPLDSAIRELHEELGINAKANELKFIGTFPIKYEHSFNGRLFKDKEISNVFIYTKDIELSQLTLQKEELESVDWFSIDYVINCIKNNNPNYCVPLEGIMLVKKYIENILEK